MRERLGPLEVKITKYLAENPEKNITEVARSIGQTYHSPTAKAVDNLEAKGLIYPLSEYKAKGNKIRRWGLTPDGLGEAVSNGVSMDKINVKYVKMHPELSLFFQVDKLLESEIGDEWRGVRLSWLEGILQLVKTFKITGVSEDVANDAIRGYILSVLLKTFKPISIKRAKKLEKAIRAMGVKPFAEFEIARLP
jgi:hypothetical protein